MSLQGGAENGLKTTDTTGLKFDGMENAGLEIGGPNEMSSNPSLTKPNIKMHVDNFLPTVARFFSFRWCTYTIISKRACRDRPTTRRFGAASPSARADCDRITERRVKLFRDDLRTVWRRRDRPRSPQTIAER